jgi:phosphoribosyl-ATP pyrophosphohydrolase/phosphoribosyl-AMP cyclohydrolase
MIIPSIDLIKGHAVQLVGGKVESLKVDAGDPIPIAKKFRLAGEIAVVDLDAALGNGDNVETIKELMKVARCRVGGGIRSVETALKWLNLGAPKIVLGTAATPEVLSQLPKDRVIAALDAVNGQVVVNGWTTKTGRNFFECIEELKPYVAGFLITFVEREGRMGGVDLELCQKLKDAVGPELELTIAGGVTTVAEIAALDKMNVHAQVGMALYTNNMDLGEAIAAPLISDRPDGLFPTVVVNESHVVLGLVYSSVESVKEAVNTQKGVYQSRKRGLWRKGETSGAMQDLLAIHLDCDRDSLCFVVNQHGDGFCHVPAFSCFGPTLNKGISALVQTMESRRQNAPEGSYTARLFNEPGLLEAKIKEEADELVAAKTKEEVIGEAADVIYFALAKAVRSGVSLADLEAELDRRSMMVSRRPGNAKPRYLQKDASSSSSASESS